MVRSHWRRLDTGEERDNTLQKSNPLTKWHKWIFTQKKKKSMTPMLGL